MKKQRSFDKTSKCKYCKDTGIHWFTINTPEGPEAERDVCDYCDAFDKRVNEQNKKKLVEKNKT